MAHRLKAGLLRLKMERAVRCGFGRVVHGADSLTTRLAVEGGILGKAGLAPPWPVLGIGPCFHGLAQCPKRAGGGGVILQLVFDGCLIGQGGLEQ